MGSMTWQLEAARLAAQVIMLSMHHTICTLLRLSTSNQGVQGLAFTLITVFKFKP